MTKNTKLAILSSVEIFKLLLHLDTHIAYLIHTFGPFTYVFMFLVIFAETGLVITPFLPGDSLLFVLGALSGSGFLNIFVIFFTLLAAAIIGDNSNYAVGRIIGPRVFSKKHSKIFNKSYLERTHKFFTKHGRKTIILARFIPIVRTFAPFVAGIGKMPYPTFFIFSITGNLLWVTIFTFAGYFFGGLPFIKKNFDLAVIVVIIISLLPIAIEYIKHKYENQINR